MELKTTVNIILVSSGQPSLNPRLVKEADALTHAGYTVTVLYAYWNNWGTDFDNKLLPTKKWKAIRVGGDPVNKKWNFFLSRIIHKISLKAPKLLPAFAIARAGFFLTREAKKHKADLYIAHNLGALPAAVKAAKKHNSKCGFDAEDFHRFETTDDKNAPEVILKTRIENKYIPQTDYFTASSLQIAQAYKQLFPAILPVVLLNVFPNSDIPARKTVIPLNEPLKLFWFSQTIGDGRGIEVIIKALIKLNSSNFELHLLGDIPNSNDPFIKMLNESGVNITFYAPIAPDQLIEFASRFDIGLALENKRPFNRNVCLTNKIFTYMQAGLAAIASDTDAQKQLLDKYPQIGMVYEHGDVGSLTSVLIYFDLHRDELLKTANASLKLAHDELNWGQESKKFLKIVKNSLTI